MANRQFLDFHKDEDLSKEIMATADQSFFIALMNKMVRFAEA